VLDVVREADGVRRLLGEGGGDGLVKVRDDGVVCTTANRSRIERVESVRGGKGAACKEEVRETRVGEMREPRLTLRVLESTGEKAGVLGVVKRDLAVAIKSQLEHVVVHSDDGVGRTGEVEREGVF